MGARNLLSFLPRLLLLKICQDVPGRLLERGPRHASAPCGGCGEAIFDRSAGSDPAGIESQGFAGDV